MGDRRRLQPKPDETVRVTPRVVQRRGALPPAPGLHSLVVLRRGAREAPIWILGSSRCIHGIRGAREIKAEDSGGRITASQFTLERAPRPFAPAFFRDRSDSSPRLLSLRPGSARPVGPRHRRVLRTRDTSRSIGCRSRSAATRTPVLVARGIISSARDDRSQVSRTRAVSSGCCPCSSFVGFGRSTRRPCRYGRSTGADPGGRVCGSDGTAACPSRRYGTFGARVLSKRCPARVAVVEHNERPSVRDRRLSRRTVGAAVSHNTASGRSGAQIERLHGGGMAPACTPR